MFQTTTSFKKFLGNNDLKIAKARFAKRFSPKSRNINTMNRTTFNDYGPRPTELEEAAETDEATSIVASSRTVE